MDPDRRKILFGLSASAAMLGGGFLLHKKGREARKQGTAIGDAANDARDESYHTTKSAEVEATPTPAAPETLTEEEWTSFGNEMGKLLMEGEDSSAKPAVDEFLSAVKNLPSVISNEAKAEILTARPKFIEVSTDQLAVNLSGNANTFSALLDQCFPDELLHGVKKIKFDNSVGGEGLVDTKKGVIILGNTLAVAGAEIRPVTLEVVAQRLAEFTGPSANLLMTPRARTKLLKTLADYTVSTEGRNDPFNPNEAGTRLEKVVELWNRIMSEYLTNNPSARGEEKKKLGPGAIKIVESVLADTFPRPLFATEETPQQINGRMKARMNRLWARQKEFLNPPEPEKQEKQTADGFDLRGNNKPKPE